MVDGEQGQRRPSTPFLRLLGPPPTPKTPPSDSRDPQTSPFERRQTPPARREPLNQAILTSLQRSRTRLNSRARSARVCPLRRCSRQRRAVLLILSRASLLSAGRKPMKVRRFFPRAP